MLFSVFVFPIADQHKGIFYFNIHDARFLMMIFHVLETSLKITLAFIVSNIIPLKKKKKNRQPNYNVCAVLGSKGCLNYTRPSSKMHTIAHAPHYIVIDLHKRGGSVKASQVCVYHLGRASSKQTAPVGKKDQKQLHYSKYYRELLLMSRK